jgi:hypothetical protein
MIHIRGASIILLATVGAHVGGCGEVPDPPWVLGEDPLVLALRTEVEGEGLSSFLIPAGRVRAEPLPGETIRITPFVADHDGEVDLARLAPHWLLCPLDSSGCISTLDEPGAGRPCSGWPDEHVACTLGPATVLELEIPALDPDRTLQEQVGLQIAFIAGDPALTSTDACLQALQREKTGSLRGCLLAYTFVRLGPLASLAALAQQQGVALGIELDEEIPLATATVQPNFNPEIQQLFLFGGGREITAQRDTVTVLPPGVLFGWETPGDPRDQQYYAELGELSILPLQESLDSALFFTEPDLRQTFRQQFTTASGAPSFTIFVVLSDRRGGQGWGRFDFEVSESAR